MHRVNIRLTAQRISHPADPLLFRGPALALHRVQPAPILHPHAHRHPPHKCENPQPALRIGRLSNWSVVIDPHSGHKTVRAAFSNFMLCVSGKGKIHAVTCYLLPLQHLLRKVTTWCTEQSKQRWLPWITRDALTGGEKEDYWNIRFYKNFGQDQFHPTIEPFRTNQMIRNTPGRELSTAASWQWRPFATRTCTFRICTSIHYSDTNLVGSCAVSNGYVAIHTHGSQEEDTRVIIDELDAERKFAKNCINENAFS